MKFKLQIYLLRSIKIKFVSIKCFNKLKIKLFIKNTSYRLNINFKDLKESFKLE